MTRIHGRTVLTLAALLVTGPSLAPTSAAQPDSHALSPYQNIRLWEGKAPLASGDGPLDEPLDLRASARSAAWPSFQGYRMIGFRAAREP